MDAFYSRYFPAEKGNALAAYKAQVEARLPEGSRLLDLGCGDNRRWASYRKVGRTVFGADFQRHSQLRHPKHFRLLGPDGHIPFPNASFDLIASSWVLEHVADPVHFLGEVRRVLKPGGCFVALTVNGAHYVSWIIRLVELLPHRVTQALVSRLYGRDHEDTFPVRYRLNSSRRLNRAARSAGLELVSLARFADPGYFRFWLPLLRAAVLTDWCLERLWPGLGKIHLVATLSKPAAPANGSPDDQAAWLPETSAVGV